jgi:hypothetical protein
VAELPFVDVHSVPVSASPDAVWTALVRGLATTFDHRTAARLLGCDPNALSPDFAGGLGQTLSGFRVMDSEPGHRLRLAGRHHFSSYTLTFVLDDGTLRAETHAAFPGPHGRLYRAAVIGSGGHVFLTRRMLRGIAARAS